MLIAVGSKMPAWVQSGYDEYARRFPRDMPLELIEIAAGKRGKNADIKRILEQEGEKMLAAVPRGSKIVTLEVTGDNWSSPQLANKLEQWQMDGRDVCLLVGGPEGLAPAKGSLAANALEGVAGNRAGHTVEIAENRLRPLPGLGVLGTAALPSGDGTAILVGGAARLQLHHPVGSFTEDQRVDRRVHATLRHARNASRM